MSYFVFRRFITESHRSSLPQISDRSFIFVSLLLGIIASAMLISFQTVGTLSTIGFTILAISLVIGAKSIVDLYAKIVGVSSLLDSQANFGSNLHENALQT